MYRKYIISATYFFIEINTSKRTDDYECVIRYYNVLLTYLDINMIYFIISLKYQYKHKKNS